MDNLLAVKAVLKSFELASGLKVNFFKSFIHGFNVGRKFLELVEGFLHYKVCVLPLKYLGFLGKGITIKKRSRKHKFCFSRSLRMIMISDKMVISCGD